MAMVNGNSSITYCITVILLLGWGGWCLVGLDWTDSSWNQSDRRSQGEIFAKLNYWQQLPWILCTLAHCSRQLGLGLGQVTWKKNSKRMWRMLMMK